MQRIKPGSATWTFLEQMVRRVGFKGVSDALTCIGQTVAADFEADAEGDSGDVISWPLKRLLMAEIEHEIGGAPATLADAVQSLQDGYQPYVGFNGFDVEAALSVLVVKYGDTLNLSGLLNDADWVKHDNCCPHQADPIN